MKDKMKRRVQIRHEVSNDGRVDRIVQKSYRNEASHKLKTREFAGGFFSAIKKALAYMMGFFKKRQPQHRGVSTKSYCSKFGGAFGGKKTLGNKLSKKLSRGTL